MSRTPSVTPRRVRGRPRGAPGRAPPPKANDMREDGQDRILVLGAKARGRRRLLEQGVRWSLEDDSARRRRRSVDRRQDGFGPAAEDDPGQVPRNRRRPGEHRLHCPRPRRWFLRLLGHPDPPRATTAPRAVPPCPSAAGRARSACAGAGGRRPDLVEGFRNLPETRNALRRSGTRAMKTAAPAPRRRSDLCRPAPGLRPQQELRCTPHLATPSRRLRRR